MPSLAEKDTTLFSLNLSSPPYVPNHTLPSRSRNVEYTKPPESPSTRRIRSWAAFPWRASPGRAKSVVRRCALLNVPIQTECSLSKTKHVGSPSIGISARPLVGAVIRRAARPLVSAIRTAPSGASLRLHTCPTPSPVAAKRAAPGARRGSYSCGPDRC